MSERRAGGSGYDAVVVGGGPAGTSTAILLAERGQRVALVDRARFPRVKACAEFVNPEALRILDRLGLLERARAAGAVEFHGMRLVSPGGHQTLLDFYADAGRSALGISRWALDQLAIERCRTLGVEVMEGTQVRGVLREGAQVIGVRASRAGQSVDLLGRVVVGADGHHSAVSRELGLDRPRAWPRRIGLAAHYEDFPLSDALGEMHVGRNGYCGVAPQEGGRVNVAMVVELKRVEGRVGSVAEFFERALATYPGLRERVGVARRVTPVRGVGPLARRVQRVSGDGFLLVGDAAGFFDPFTGEGIVDALRGGELAAEAINAALLRDDVTARGLAAYAAARKQVFQSKRRAAWLVQAFVRSPGLMDYAVRRIAGRDDCAAALTGVFGDYRDAGVVLSPRFLWRTLRP